MRNITILPVPLDRVCACIENDSRYGGERREKLPSIGQGFRPADESFVENIEDWRVTLVGPAFIKCDDIPDTEGPDELRSPLAGPIEATLDEEFLELLKIAAWQPHRIHEILEELSTDEEIAFWLIFTRRIAEQRRLRKAEEAARHRHLKHAKAG